ncbi:death ligand signal enhancer isoform X2 [Alligator mississippiensis]|uniref:Death ligand signal enhancer n=1 Tax=Alligator mississippiensis TaxID=8496 RepID=A0A151MH35_ALLMI|nr:death ligand signal enhancer isoform X2 [Alligator mississippiensis]KYO23803.1 death ligand signal enhancer [Alligator mississippiensis]
MWRFPGLLSRAFHRLQVLNVSSPLHGIPPITSSEKFQSNTSMHCTGCCLSEQSHYFQSPDWHNRQHQDGWKQKRGKHLLSSLLPHYTILHSLTWGTLAIFALQLTWQIPWLSSVPVVGRENKPPWLDSFYSSLLCHQHSVLAAAPANCPSGQKGPCFLLAMIPDIAPESPSPGIPLGQEVDCCCSEMGDLSFPDCSSFRPAHSSKQVKTAQQECLKEAVSQLQQVFQANTSTALNILGIRSIKAGHYRAAYICFKLAADQGYNKAQFNVGLCYEHGRGTKTALGKAALYYRHAARSGHLKAQYRYARCLLHYGSKAEKADLQKARTLLEQAAAAGLMEAQAYLGVLYMKGMFPAKQKALKYLWLAAKNGDSQSRYHVGVCYEEGLGVQKNLAEAVNNYQQSAAAGNRLAWGRVQALEQQYAASGTNCLAPYPRIRTVSSSPSLLVHEQTAPKPQASQADRPGLTLSHSWSTGSCGAATIRNLR